MMTIPESFKWDKKDLKELNALPIDEKHAFLKKNEIKIRQSLGEAVPTIIFRKIANNINKAISFPLVSNNEVKKIAARSDSHPTVVTEMVISGIWSVPGGQSYMARIIRDAGGDYLWADDKNTGSLSLDFNQVLAHAQNADYWFIKWTNINSLSDLQGVYDLNKEMEAFKNKRVYVCDTEKSRFFDRVPFHPDLLLREFAAIMHPELFPEVKTSLYHHLD